MTLIERIRFRLCMLRLGLTTKPIAGADGEGEGSGGEGAGEGAGTGAEGGEGAAGAEGGKGGEGEPSGEQKPPWGSDEEFKPEKAWDLIQNLRGDKDTLKAERDDARGKVKTFEDAQKSESDKLEERATSAEEDAKKANTEAARLRVALKKGLSETQAKRLVGDSEEDLEKDADELLESFKSEEDEGEKSSRTPRERLRSGAAPSAEPDETDPRKLAGKVSRL